MKAREDVEEMRGSVVGLVHNVGLAHDVGLVHQAVGCHEGPSMADHRHRVTLSNLNKNGMAKSLDMKDSKICIKSPNSHFKIERESGKV